MRTTWITVCDTCKRDEWETRGMAQTDGEILADEIEKASRGTDAVKIRRHSCLMGCSNGCNVTIQAGGKLCYTLGGFVADAEAAAGIVDYAALHAASDTGQVPYRNWPTAIKGHFVTRHPPLPTE